MPFSSLIALFQDAAAPDAGGSQGTVRIVAGVLALLLVVIIVMRRKSGSKKKEEDDF